MRDWVPALLGMAAIVTLVGILLVGASIPTTIEADWRLDPRYPVGPDTTELHLIAQQHSGGSGGGRPWERALPPLVTYAVDSIHITVPLKQLGNGLMLEGSFPVVVHLDQAVGGRQIVPGPGAVLVDDLSSFSPSVPIGQ